MCNEHPAVGKHSVLMPRLSVAGGFNRFHVPPLLKVMTVRMLGFFPTFRDFLRCFMLRRRKNNNVHYDGKERRKMSDDVEGSSDMSLSQEELDVLFEKNT